MSSSDSDQQLSVLEKKSNDLGACLKMTRIKSNMKTHEVAKTLNLTTDVIEYLEGGRYEFSKKHVFYRGYLRLYSHLLGLSSDDIVNAYNDIIQHDGISVDVTDTRVETYSSPALLISHNIRWVSYALLASALFFVGIWWYKQGTSNYSSSIEVASNTIDLSNRKTT